MAGQGDGDRRWDREMGTDENERTEEDREGQGRTGKDREEQRKTEKIWVNTGEGTSEHKRYKRT